MDAFYAAVEQLDDPTLRGRPLLVGPNSARGVVLTASYEARPFGVGSAMPMARARRLCPQALIVPPRFERYQQMSKIIMDLFGDFSPDVEALSLDEAFLDMTGSDKLFGSPEAIGRRLKAAVRDATGGLTASVGISGTKYVAKVASGHRKPDGLTIVPPDEARAWLAPQPVKNLWGAGPKTAARLEALGLHTIGDVASCDPRRLERSFGALGHRFIALAHGDDGLAGLDQVLGPFVELLEIVRSVVEVLAPLDCEPADVGFDHVDISLLLLHRTGIVEAQAAMPAEFLRDAKIQADRLGVTDMEIAVGFGRKTRDHGLVATGTRDCRPDDVADKILPRLPNPCFAPTPFATTLPCKITGHGLR